MGENKRGGEETEGDTTFVIGDCFRRNYGKILAMTRINR